MSLSKFMLLRGKLSFPRTGVDLLDVCMQHKTMGSHMYKQLRPQVWHALYVRGIAGGLIQRPATGRNMPGQGLKKFDPEEDKLMEEKSLVLRFINRKIEEQKRGTKAFPLLPDYKFYLQLILWSTVLFTSLKLLWPDFLEKSMKVKEEPTVNEAVISTSVQSPQVKLYKLLPLRLISRLWGRINNVELFDFLRAPVLKLYASVFDVNMEEALVQDFKVYKNLGEFFRRPIDMKFRPIDETMNIVCPSDGKVLALGKVQNGVVEQVKGVTYSLQQFLGPLMEEPSHDRWGQKEGYTHDWSRVPLDVYQSALMKNREKNALYHCVIYLAPGDYHRFHSPAQWTLKYRRHFPGNLLSVNPRVAALVKDLFVLNERVVLSGEWEHGFFSMTAVGATNVGSVKIYEDILLRTNRAIFKKGTYFDRKFGDKGFFVNKGDLIGEFNLGSTIILVFEAPKDAKFVIKEGRSIKVGEGMC